MRTLPDEPDAVNSAAHGKAGLADPVRTCILTRDRQSRDALVRLALGPDGQVLPDVRAKAPGRGAWIGVTRAELEAAIAKGKLQGRAVPRLQDARPFAIPADLPDRSPTRCERNALDRLGLEAKAGHAADRSASGSRRRRDRASSTLLLHAVRRRRGRRAQARPGMARRHRIAKARDLKGLALPVPRTILSLALGRENVVHVGLTDPAAAKRVSDALDRWLHFIGPEPRPEPCETGLARRIGARPCRASGERAERT